MAKQTVKIADLANLTRSVDISESEQITVRALNLREMVTLFVEEQAVFLPLYSAGIEGKTTAEDLTPFLLSAPHVVARVIAMASDDAESMATVERYMPATVQLIALSEIWRASVPDQKKASELLSEVTKLLQKLSEKVEAAAQKTSSPTSLPLPSTS